MMHFLHKLGCWFSNTHKISDFLEYLSFLNKPSQWMAETSASNSKLNLAVNDTQEELRISTLQTVEIRGLYRSSDWNLTAAKYLYIDSDKNFRIANNISNPVQCPNVENNAKNNGNTTIGDNTTVINQRDEIISTEKVTAIMDSIIYRCVAPSMITDTPMFLGMTNLTVTLSGTMTRQMKERLISMVLMMNGRTLKHYDNNATHIVGTQGLTQKVIHGRKNKLPIMTTDWLIAIWEASQTDPYVHASCKRFQMFAMPLFHNVTFCISDEVQNEMRTILTNLIYKHGGRTEHEVISGQTDVLICVYPFEINFQTARRIGIPTMTPAWITVCTLFDTIVDYGWYEVKHPQEDGEKLSQLS